MTCQKSPLECKKCFDYAMKTLIRTNFEFRKLDGSNNNPNGKVMTKFIRLLPSQYGDGKNTPAGATRPSPRVISNKIFKQEESIPNSKCASNMFWLWGQFIDHDITLTPTGKTECLDISVPIGDPSFDPENTGTQKIPFKRSQFDPTTGTSTSNPRQQFNKLTSYIDSENIYGNDEERNHYIRRLEDGLLKTSAGNFLPMTDGYVENEGNPKRTLFVGGDLRANEHIGLTAMHCLWVREHNYWAKKIKKYSHCLCDEQIYQRAKIMVEAEMQHITMNEFLPLLLGEYLSPYCGYQPNVNPQLSSEFAAAAFRLGHSLISSKIYDRHGLTLKDTFFAPYMLCNGDYYFSMDSILDHFALSQAQELDAKVINDLRNFLFGKPGEGGLDLVSLNIQRGRDHGLPDYEKVRQGLGTPVALSQQSKDKLKCTYNNDLNNVDLFVGGLMETPKDKSMLGPLFHKIVKEQFEKIRDGDKFWYECRLPYELLKLIKCTKLSDIIKRNTDIKHVQKWTMVIDPYRHGHHHDSHH